MCGIAGAINFNSINLEAMQAALLHRGPDAQNIYKKEHVALLHTRLAIQDIASGTQPLHVKNFSIVFNGEIYNHQELRATCLKGVVFKTRSDTETLLHMYIRYGKEMFGFIDGMFAFAILDHNVKKLILARDRAGKKPLYMYNDASKVVFASELNALRAGLPSLRVNNEAIQTYLRCGFFSQTLTPFENVKELKPGHIVEICTQTLGVVEKEYFDIASYYLSPLNIRFDEALEMVELALKKSVHNRLESSDLEVGAFLSGGIDSSLVVALASRHAENIKTFTVKFDGGYDESCLARLTAERYGTEHHELSISMNLKNDIERILLSYGEPFMDSSAIPSFYVSQEAKKHVTVVLNGDGADELFGGYRRYVPLANNWLGLAKYFSWLINVLPAPHEKKSAYNYAFRLLSMANKQGLDRYLSATTDIFEDVYAFKANDTLTNLDTMIKSNSMPEFSKQLYHDFILLLSGDLLVKMDIATMAHSLEGRSPFLSKYMLELAPRIKDDYKVKGRTTKHILRELAKKHLPAELITQPKRGFEVPLKKWVKLELKDNIFDQLARDSFASTFIEKKFIHNLLEEKVNVSDEKRAKMLWTLYCLDVWHKGITN